LASVLSSAPEGARHIPYRSIGKRSSEKKIWREREDRNEGEGRSAFHLGRTLSPGKNLLSISKHVLDRAGRNKNIRGASRAASTSRHRPSAREIRAEVLGRRAA
jgi:hypothetical protein